MNVLDIEYERMQLPSLIKQLIMLFYQQYFRLRSWFVSSLLGLPCQYDGQ